MVFQEPIERNLNLETWNIFVPQHSNLFPNMFHLFHNIFKCKYI
nr:MAG TPA: hypothetical protein [Caudoviricetes sp.]